MSESTASRPTDPPELFIGLVGAIGTDLGSVCSALEASLSNVSYASHSIRLSNLLNDLPRWSPLAKIRYEDKRYDAYMSAGNEFRRVSVHAA